MIKINTLSYFFVTYLNKSLPTGLFLGSKKFKIQLKDPFCNGEPMDWQLLGLSFITVFVAEIGDKSQLATIALGGSTSYPKAVFLGSIAALLSTSFLGVLVGGEMAIFLPTKLLKALAAAGFALMAIKLFHQLRHE
jgi:putative Ca2+/H+ antiporter (TMEM165/GDT1 family)